MELNAEQIKKALECCIVNDWNSTKCNECPIYNGGGGCIDELKEATLTLINSQEQRIKELTEELVNCRTDNVKLTKENAYLKHIELEAMRSEANYYKMHVTELTEENERLRAIPEQLHKEMSE